jgi:hypothetical protein
MITLMNTTTLFNHAMSAYERTICYRVPPDEMVEANS